MKGIFSVLQYSDTARCASAINGSHQDIHFLHHDEFFSHTEANIHLEFVIPCGKFYFSSQDAAFRIHFIDGQFKSVANIVGIGCGRSRIGINNSHFDRTLGSYTSQDAE